MERQKRIELLGVFAGRFSKVELRSLCFVMDLPFENFADSRLGLAVDMLVYCENRNLVPALIQAT